MKQNPEISVVILTRNAGSQFRQTLEMIFSQKVDCPFEVIVIDSGSEDKTLKTCKEFPINLFTIEPEEFNHGTMRNLGASKANGKYIVFIVQDAIPFDESWMRALIQPFYEDQMVAGVYSRHIPHKDANPFIKKVFETSLVSRDTGRIIQNLDHIPKDNNLTSRELHKFYVFNNVSSAIKRDVWEKYPFSSISFAEDLDWSKRVIDSGYNIVYEPSSAVYHSHQRSMKEEFKRVYVSQKTICGILKGNEKPPSFIKLTKSILNILINSLQFLNADISMTGRFRTVAYAVSYNISWSIGMYLAKLSPSLIKHYKWYRFVDKKIITGI